ncbi:MAG: LapA family protein [Gammaproteobacteria bacterium]|jgi:uncharacterized integral membrane protein|nr:LapA family protein [Gammaproteobacteria bacterium]
MDMRLMQIIIYVVFIVVALIFAALNATPVTLQLYWKSMQFPLAFIMVFCFVIGMLISALVFTLKYGMLFGRYQKLKNQVGLLEQEIKNLRTLPIQDSH